MKRSLGLRSRLFLSHMLVMLVSLSCYILVNRLVSFRYFEYHLENQKEFLPLKAVLLGGFVTAWRASTVWSVITGALFALLLSYWVAQRITTPLIQMEQTTHRFAAGQVETRLPGSAVPEINQLHRSFNRMAMRLEQVEQKRQELIGDLAHELRTPLTIIRGNLEELADERIAPSAKIFHRLLREVRRLERLVMDLQLLSLAETGHLPLQLQAVSIPSLLEQVRETITTQLRDDGPTLQIDCPVKLPLVWVDLDRTEQILMNLIGNALRYTEQGHITVQTEVVNQKVWMTVTDTGPGISAEDLPHIFDRFWRSQYSRVHYAGGTGLGLAITRRLVELQSGQITVKSQFGQGSQFRFSLPLAASPTPL